MVWWNLRRFNRAQREGVFRVRQEFGPGMPQTGYQQSASPDAKFVITEGTRGLATEVG
jgi:hypothetical protein